MCIRDRPKGVVVQFGGQTAINLAEPLSKAGVKILGTQVADLDRAEDRDLFEQALKDLDIPQPPGQTATNEEEAVEAARKIGFPVLVRPSYVLGGRAMEIVENEDDLRSYMRTAVKASPDHPCLLYTSRPLVSRILRQANWSNLPQKNPLFSRRPWRN